MDTSVVNAEMSFAHFHRVRVHMRKTGTLHHQFIFARTVERMQRLQLQLKNEVCMTFFCFDFSETKRYCFGLYINCLHTGG